MMLTRRLKDDCLAVHHQRVKLSLGAKVEIWKALRSKTHDASNTEERCGIKEAGYKIINRHPAYHVFLDDPCPQRTELFFDPHEKTRC